MSFKLFTICNIPVRINILSVIIMGVLLALGMFKMLVISMVALSLHELSHVIMAKRLGAVVNYIEIQPCGFTAAIQSFSSATNELLIAFSGPCFSIICGACIVCFLQVVGFDSEILRDYALFNLVLGIVNLIPVMPLDGGRIFHAVVCKIMPPKIGNRLCIALSLIIAVCSLVTNVYAVVVGALNFTAIIVGLLVVVGTLTQIKIQKTDYVLALARKNAELYNGVKVNSIALSETKSVAYAISLCRSNCYNKVEIIGGDMQVVGTVDEGELISCPLLHRDMPLSELVRRKK